MVRGEVWWVAFPNARGGEIRKTRPGIIVSHDAFNRNLNRVQVVPTTKNIKNVYPGETLVKIGDQTSKVMASQIATVTKEMVLQRVGEITADELIEVERAIRIQLGLGR